MSMPDSHTTRRYVDVIARWRDDGAIVPLSVCWPDGRTFQIEQVIGQPISNSFPGEGVRTLRYTVQIGSRKTHLYLEQEVTAKGSTDRWYVEALPYHAPWYFGRLHQ
ncbi:uncharacterized protein BN494_00245 [Eggerthella sp. CAG:1427]|nr:uncharacterized protein BN494_00245 [Eggerthella sp. CAG:1427]